MKTDSESRRLVRPVSIILGFILICAALAFYFLSYSSSEIANSLRKVKPGMSIKVAEKKIGLTPYRVIKEAGRHYHAFNLFPDVEAKIAGKRLTYIVETDSQDHVLTTGAYLDYFEPDTWKLK